MNSCAFCGQVNEADARFCVHCGTSLEPPTVPAVSTLSGSPPGTRPDPSRPGSDDAEPRPGIASVATTAVSPPDHRNVRIRLALLDDAGATKMILPFGKDVVTIGRERSDLGSPDDTYLSPSHAQFVLRDHTLVLRDLGSRNGSWVFLDGPHRLVHGHMLLIGLQLLRFRRLGYPAPQSPEPDGTRRVGSLTPTPDVAILEQLRADGSVRDTFHLSPGRSVTIGRDDGDWVFRYDQTMSRRHAVIRAENGEFVVYDLGSRNGVALSVRGECALRSGQRVLLGRV